MSEKKEEKDYTQPIVTAKYGTHRFKFYLRPNNAEIEFTVDGYDEKNKIKEIQGNKVIFKETIELFVNNNDIEFVDGVTLSEIDSVLLKSERNLLSEKIRKEKDRVRDWSIENKTKKELLSMVDKHTKKVRNRNVIRGGLKMKEKYCTHIFRVGNETIRMVERFFNDKRYINPDYKVLGEFPTVGGLAEKEGELMVWKYYYELDEPSKIDSTKKRGFWETARPMRYSEQICYEIINRYGVFASKDYDKEKFGIDSQKSESRKKSFSRKRNI